jgi:hypothetical protein
MEEGGDPSGEEEGDPVEEQENEDGTITQYFDDGSSITYGEDGEVVSVTDTEGVDEPFDLEEGGSDEEAVSNLSEYSEEQIDEMIKLNDQILSGRLTDYEIEDAESKIAEIENNPLGGTQPAVTARGVTVGASGQQYENPDSAVAYQNAGIGTGADTERLQTFLDDIPRTSAVTDGGATQASQSNVQYFDDGSSITYDEEGNVVGVTNTDGTASSSIDREKTRNDANPPLKPLADVNINRTRTTPPEGWPDGFVSNDDGTATYVDPEDGSTITIDADSNILFVTDANGETVAQDNEAVTTGGLTQANQNIQYFDDGSYIQTYDDGTSVTFDSEGNPFRSTDTEGNSELAKTSTYDDYGNQTISDYYGNIVKVLDPQGNVIPLGGGRVNTGQITGAGSTGAIDTDLESAVQKRIADQKVGSDTQSAINNLLAGLNTYGGAGAAGAVLGALLSDSDLFSGGGGGGSNFDMTGVGAINPRTTDFGIGPANYVGYDEYGTPEQMPELYGQELYQNLNAPGFNEVNPGDYARYDAEEFGEPEGEYMEEEQGMAEGGMPKGGLGQTAPQTYYTFGTPVDPLQNLRNPAPFQQQPQQPQMQPQMPPQAAQNAQQAPQGMQPMGMPQPMAQMPQMPQGMPPAGMKSGGLPEWSNVPITNGRLNFRQGAAVHGAGDGQSDDIPAMLADGEYVLDAELVAQIGNGSTKAGAQALDRFRENIRAHKRSAPINKIPPKTKALTSYLKGAR